MISLVFLVLGLALCAAGARGFRSSVSSIASGTGFSWLGSALAYPGFLPDRLAIGAAASFHGLGGVLAGVLLGTAAFELLVVLGIAFISEQADLTAALRPGIRSGPFPGQRTSRLNAQGKAGLPEALRSLAYLSLASLALLAILGSDGYLSRLDGVVLLVAFALALPYALRRSSDLVPETFLRSPRAAGSGVSGASPRSRDGLRLIAWLIALVVSAELVSRGVSGVTELTGVSEELLGALGLPIVIGAFGCGARARRARQRTNQEMGRIVLMLFGLLALSSGLIALIEPFDLVLSAYYLHIPVLLAAILVAIQGIRRPLRRKNWGFYLLALYLAYWVVAATVL